MSLKIRYTTPEHDAMAAELGLTPLELCELKTAVRQTYHYVFQELGPSGRTGPYRGLYHRDEVIEIILKAEHIFNHGPEHGRRRRSMSASVRILLMKQDAATRELLTEALRKELTAEWYEGRHSGSRHNAT